MTYTFIHVCGCIYEPVVMQIIYLTFNLRTVLGMGSNSAICKNTSFCISCLQPWKKTSQCHVKSACHINLSLNLSFKACMSWYMPPPYLLILNLIYLCNHYSRWMSWFESISYNSCVVTHVDWYFKRSVKNIKNRSLTVGVAECLEVPCWKARCCWFDSRWMHLFSFL